MAARYVEISAEEFESFAEENYFEQIEYPRAREIVYAREAQAGHARILIFSSIHIGNGKGRDVGKDAVRVIVQAKVDSNNVDTQTVNVSSETWRVIWKSKRVHRVKNWRKNLESRIVDAIDYVHPDPCPECNNAMILREGKYGRFYSCIMWPKTGCRGRQNT